MNPQLRKLADSFGVRFSERSCYHSNIWDGKTLALNHQLEIMDHPGDVLPLDVSRPQPLSDFDICHEIAHYAVAEPHERKLPEYGCMWATSFPYYVTGGITDYKKLFIASQGELHPSEQDWREACAYFLTLHWCERMGIWVPEESRLTHRLNCYCQGSDKIIQQKGWKAIAWLRAQNLIP